MGQARFKQGETRPITRKQLNTTVKRYLPYWPGRAAEDGKFYELSLSSGPAFLAVQTTPGPSPLQDRYCSVVSKNIKYWTALEAVHPHPSQLAEKGSAQRRQMDRMGSHRTTSSFGYQVIVQRLDGGYVAMTTILPGQRRLNSDEYKRLGKGPGR